MSDGAKKLKRGEILFKEGDQPTAIYMIQSGKVGLMLDRNGKLFEVASLGTSQVFGEQALFSSGKQAFTAQALQESRVLEIPVDLMKAQFEKSPTGVKLLVKSLVDDVKLARQQMRQSKMESEKSPMPQGLIHKIFTEVHLIARHIGKKDAEKETITVAWNALKMYANRFFGEAPQRLRQLMDLLAKLKLAELKMAKSEETGEEELTDVVFHKVQVYEDFAEFYQYHLFKGSKAEAIYVDPLGLKVAKALVEVSEGAPVNHKGASSVDYQVALNECKTKYRLELKNTHLDVLERKGLFVQRKSHDDGKVELLFDRAEFVKTAYFWSIIFEIDKWNEKGSVDLNEKEEIVAGADGECPGCKAKVEAIHKFCPSCGFKLAQAA